MARNMRVPNIHWCNSRPRLPRGFSRLCSGPAPKPSSEIEKPATRTLGITHSLPYQRFYGRPDDGVSAAQAEIIGHSARISEPGRLCRPRRSAARLQAGLRRSTGGVHRQATDRLIEVRPGLDNIARGFGLRGHEIRDVSVEFD